MCGFLTEPRSSTPHSYRSLSGSSLKHLAHFISVLLVERSELVFLAASRCVIRFVRLAEQTSRSAVLRPTSLVVHLLQAEQILSCCSS